MSLARLNLAAESEEVINKQIQTELTASYAYLSMSAWLARDNVALHNISEYYRKESHEEREHATHLIDYLTKRGGRVQFLPIPQPESEWKSATNVLEATLAMERDVTQSLMNVVAVAEKHGDAEMAEYITSEFLHEQVEAVKKAADYVTQLNTAGGTGLGLYMFDKTFRKCD